ncbi:malate synthase A [Marivirga sp. S37H4]|uniref:Malate synthase n=1 Tax=Marivirga aurantiaca TaxID=2802615 RepID=A0A934WV05_9BACT|nr:malate synthase A [Marivirga aurantiaca]MBK6263534.1 malate synthase A [Marivirga aurantiaca]
MESKATMKENVEMISEHPLLTDAAKAFLFKLDEQFNSQREKLLALRKEKYERIAAGEKLDFLESTRRVREYKEWSVAPIPQDLQDRRVEITGPVDRKMIINALNSDAKVFMADFEDATSPIWQNILDGQQNLYDAIRNQIDFTAPNGKSYQLKEDRAVLKVRPRGWHLPEKHFLVNDRPISASLFDFGLYFYHNAQELLRNGSGPYFYLPKLESHEEARLWNDVFTFAQEELGVPHGTIKATVLIETITAAFEMEEIIYELKDHMAGLNAGRWDYIFSAIKVFRNDPEFILPDRSAITMSVPFMKAYANLLVKTCHKRGAHAIGGMSAFIPSKDEMANQKAFEKVKKDKTLEAEAGYDGTWVAHPGLIPPVLEVFNPYLEGRSDQKHILREDFTVTAEELTDPDILYGLVTEKGVRMNINVALLYIESWLQGTGAAALYNLMEDAATAEISRAQLWQWYHHNVEFKNGCILNKALFLRLLNEELAAVKEYLGEKRVDTAKIDLAAILLEDLVVSEEFEDFLTLKAYPFL